METLILITLAHVCLLFKPVLAVGGPRVGDCVEITKASAV